MIVSYMDNEQADWLAILDDGLRRNPGMISLQFDRAMILQEMGQTAEAEAAFVAILNVDRQHADAMLMLGHLYMRTNRLVDAFRTYHAFVETFPSDAVGHTNIGYVYFLGEQWPESRYHYELAIALAPQDTLAHSGLADVLEKLGEIDTAEEHRFLAKVTPGLRIEQYRGPGKPKQLLLVVADAENQASAAFDLVLDDTVFQVSRLAIDHWNQADELPACDIFVNGIVDAERSTEALSKVQELADRQNLKLVNLPSAIAQTTRGNNAQRLSSIDNVRTPVTVYVNKEQLLNAQRLQCISDHGLAFPFLLRAPGFFAGRQFYWIANEAELDQAIGSLATESYILIEYIDTRDQNGMYRKYRSLFIDGKVYPLHMALSTSWKVHYFSADMTTNVSYREHEAAFLKNAEQAIGAPAMAALSQIAQELQLDFAGADYGFDGDGRLVVFETNAAMSVAFPGPEPIWDYRRRSVNTVLAAATAMLLKRSKTR